LIFKRQSDKGIFCKRIWQPRKIEKTLRLVKNNLSYPDDFTAHICMAQNWLAMKASSDTVSVEKEANRACNHFEHPKLGNILNQIFTSDARDLHQYMPRRAYRLILANIPYGFN
jgi:hypothetical protein